jgi:endonuclease/exonuclease/phosphatase (EEP) superfamily protein YafD
MTYSPKLKGMFEVLEKYNNYDISMLVRGDLNLDLRGSHETEFIEMIRTKIELELSNGLATSTSRNSTCIDAVFYRHIEQLEMREYVSYFSTHRPLLSITKSVVNDDSVV